LLFLFFFMVTMIRLAGNSLNCTTDELIQGTCSFDYNKTVGIKKDANPDEVNDPNLLVADVVLGATFFIGTIAFLGIVVSGLQMIFQGGTDPKKAADAMKGVKYSLIGLVIVIFSYTIIRLIQYFVGGKI
ncbi:MAG TPA: hypothetical protein PLW93_05255, partial [Candidatus Absconditabacterales bacterium]|nr:hypothetical protein [Candidatus Absconditabacterales bacterium]